MTTDYKIETNLLQELSSEQAFHYRVIPIENKNGTLKLKSDKVTSSLKQELQIILNKDIELIEDTSNNIEQYLSTNFRQSKTNQTEDLNYSKDFLEKILLSAKDIGSSDIHFEPYEYKIYCSSFMILSLMINAMGNNAYNSLKTRAMMIDNLNKPCVKKMLSKYYYDGEDLCIEILSFMDYHRASIGFLEAQEIQNAQNCRNWAQENLDKMLSLPQYKAMTGMPEQTIQRMSQENQIHLLNNMLQDYKNGAFKLSKSEFENAISNYRIKPRSGFGSWI